MQMAVQLMSWDALGAGGSQQRVLAATGGRLPVQDRDLAGKPVFRQLAAEIEDGPLRPPDLAALAEVQHLASTRLYRCRLGRISLPALPILL